MVSVIRPTVGAFLLLDRTSNTFDLEMTLDVERYPQHVERLILISPAGVNAEGDSQRKRIREKAPLHWRIVAGIFSNFFFPYMTVGNIFRTFPSWSEKKCLEYVERRLPSITDREEQLALSDYLYFNAALPGSAEHCLSRLLTPYAYGRKPTETRIPHLRVPYVSFLYGETDWMDSSGGLNALSLCENQPSAPKVDVFRVSSAGHLLMLENWNEFNNSILISAGFQPEQVQGPLPTKLSPVNAPESETKHLEHDAPRVHSVPVLA